MKSLTLRGFTKNIQVVSNAFSAFEDVKKSIDPESYVIVLGGLRHDCLASDISELKALLAKQPGAYVLSDTDARAVINIDENSNYENIAFLKEQNTFVHVEYTDRSGFTFVYGGIPKAITSWPDMKTSVEVCFVNKIKEDGAKFSWHKKYNGSLGYVCSFNPPNELNEVSLVEYFLHSCSTGNKEKRPNIVTFNRQGIVGVIWPKV